MEDDGSGRDGAATARFVSHLSGDFFFMGSFLVLGAAIAAAVQTFVPQTIVATRGETCPSSRSWR